MFTDLQAFLLQKEEISVTFNVLHASYGAAVKDKEVLFTDPQPSLLQYEEIRKLCSLTYTLPLVQ